jgi:hypothetical protein
MGAKGFVDGDGGNSSEDMTSDVNKKLERIGSRCRRSLYYVSLFNN